MIGIYESNICFEYVKGWFPFFLNCNIIYSVSYMCEHFIYNYDSGLRSEM